ncbi:hypothetical protein GQ44DRAFT_776259 [Phaeosphaeriaceae sp. PMI808]|nr:hypothetical protein GQ44DRAFT_776259 [Phaeosphaeriaceae sp. PMI808]
MPGLPIAVNRIIVLFVAFVFVCIIIFSAASVRGSSQTIHRIKESAQSAANNICNNDRPLFGNPTISNAFLKLYEAIQHPVDSRIYTDAAKKSFEIKEDAPWWKEPLREQILILDIDTRVPNGPNELWNDGRMDWETMNSGGDGGMVSASFMNHFLYSQIHGYDYRFFNAHEMEGMHNTWVKPHALYDLLKKYRFVIFIDADATIQHLELPFEWLFNRWGVTPETSIAMPLDTRQILNGDVHASEDSRGKLQLNTGVVIAQALPLTFDLLTAWKECPGEKKYPGCGEWKEAWSHEQKAFSEYIRYDFNPNGTNIVEIPCNDAMGYPGLSDNHSWITSNCTGQFIRHHTIDKAMTKTSTELAMLQSLTDLTRKALLGDKQKYWIRET